MRRWAPRRGPARGTPPSRRTCPGRGHRLEGRGHGGEAFTVEVQASGPAETTFAFPPELAQDAFELRTAAAASPLPPAFHRYQANRVRPRRRAVPPIRCGTACPMGEVQTRSAQVASLLQGQGAAEAGGRARAGGARHRPRVLGGGRGPPPARRRSRALGCGPRRSARPLRARTGRGPTPDQARQLRAGCSRRFGPSWAAASTGPYYIELTS